MLRFTLRQLEYFVAVCECGSIALASEKVHVSSPSISAAITCTGLIADAGRATNDGAGEKGVERGGAA